MVRQDQTKWQDDVRRGVHEHLALGQGLANQSDFKTLQIAKTTMNQFSRCRGSGAAQITLFTEKHRKPAPRSVAGNAAAIDAPTNNGKIVNQLGIPLTRLPGRSHVRAIGTVMSSAL